MRKTFKKSLIILSLFFPLNFTHASMLWEINTAIDEYSRGNFSFCKKYLEEYAISNPNDPDGYYLLAMVHKKLKDEQNAKQNFKKAYALDFNEKNIEKINFGLDENANIEDYFDMAAMYFEDGNLKEAETYADMMLKINPKSSSAYFIKAKIAMINGKEKSAKEYMNYAIAYNPKLIKTNLAKSLKISGEPEFDEDTYSFLALESYFDGELNKTIDYLKKCLEKDNSNIDILNFLSEAYIKSGNYNQAQKTLDEAFKINKKNIQTFIIQAKLYHIQKDYEQAEKFLLQAREINPNNAQVLLKLGNYALRKKDYNTGYEYFEALANINDNNYEAAFGYAFASIEKGMLDSAAKIIRNLSSINNESGEIPFLLAQICAKYGDYKTALDYLSQALNICENPFYYLSKAKIHYILKNYEESIEALLQAQKMKPYYIEEEDINSLLAQNYLKLNDAENAEKYINKILDKNTIIYKYNLYVLHKLKGDDKKYPYTLSKIKKIKPASVLDYIDMSEILYQEQNLNAAIKILDCGLKKFPKEAQLYYQKIQLYYQQDEKDKLKETIEKLSDIK